MTTIIERPSGDGDSGTILLAVIVGVLAAAVIGMFAFGAFDRQTTTLKIEDPAAATAPTTAPQAAPADQPPASAPQPEPPPQ